MDHSVSKLDSTLQNSNNPAEATQNGICSDFNVKLYSLYPSQHEVFTTKYVTNVDPRGYIVVYEYQIEAPDSGEKRSLMMDYQTRAVNFTSICKALAMKKVDVIKLVEDCPTITPIKIRGGFLKIQGTWLDWDVARRLSLRIAWRIKKDLIPIFGNEFPSLCLPLDHPGFGKLTLDLIDPIQNSSPTPTRPPPTPTPIMRLKSDKAIPPSLAKPTPKLPKSTSNSRPRSTISNPCTSNPRSNPRQLNIEVPPYHEYVNESHWSTLSPTLYSNSTSPRYPLSTSPSLRYSPYNLDHRVSITPSLSRSAYYQNLQNREIEFSYSFERKGLESSTSSSSVGYELNYGPSPTYTFGTTTARGRGNSLPGTESFDSGIQRRNSITSPIGLSPPRRLLLLPEMEATTSEPVDSYGNQNYGNFSRERFGLADREQVRMNYSAGLQYGNEERGRSKGEKWNVADGNRKNGMRCGEML